GVGGGVGHAEVREELLLGIPPLLVAEHDQRAALEAGQPADDGVVVGEGAVAVQLHELLGQEPDQVQRVGPPGVSRQLHPLPRGEAAEDLLLQPAPARLQLGDLVGRAGDRALPEAGDARLQLDQRLLEVERVGHGYSRRTLRLPSRPSTAATNAGVGPMPMLRERTRTSWPSASTWMTSGTGPTWASQRARRSRSASPRPPPATRRWQTAGTAAPPASPRRRMSSARSFRAAVVPSTLPRTRRAAPPLR